MEPKTRYVALRAASSGASPWRESVSVSAATRAAKGFSDAGSSSAATARTAESTSAIWAGKASRKNPETRKVTSTRGRSRTESGITSVPVARPEAVSQVGRTPINASAWAMSSPPVRMLLVPQAVTAMARGQDPCSCMWRSMIRHADFQPSVQAAGVGTMRVSTEKKLRPVGSTSVRPRVGAPDGPGSTNRPSRPVRSPSISAPPEAATAPRTRRSSSLRTACVPRHRFGAGRAPETKSWASDSSRSTVSPAVRQGSPPRSARGRGPDHTSADSQSRGSKSSPKSRASARWSDSAPASFPLGTRKSATRRSVASPPVG